MKIKRSYLCWFLVGLLTLLSVSSALAGSVGSLPEFMEVSEENLQDSYDIYESPLGRSAASDLADFTRMDTYFLRVSSTSSSDTFNAYGNSFFKLDTLRTLYYHFNPYHPIVVTGRHEVIVDVISSNGFDDTSLEGTALNLVKITTGGNSSAPTGLARISDTNYRFSFDRDIDFYPSSYLFQCPGPVFNNESSVIVNVYVQLQDYGVSEGGGEGGGTGGSGSST